MGIFLFIKLRFHLISLLNQQNSGFLKKVTLLQMQQSETPRLSESKKSD